MLEVSQDITHAVGFLQNAYTIILALALGEAFRQFIADSTEKSVQWKRLPALLAFLFLIFPFFHGMSRYFYVTYLSGQFTHASYAASLMFDGIIFMSLSAFFFGMSRSLSPENWQRFYCFLLMLLLVDSVWVSAGLWRSIPLKPWLELDVLLAGILLLVLFLFRKTKTSLVPAIICAVAIFSTTLASYFLMQDFYFPLHIENISYPGPG